MVGSILSTESAVTFLRAYFINGYYVSFVITQGLKPLVIQAFFSTTKVVP